MEFLEMLPQLTKWTVDGTTSRLRCHGRIPKESKIFYVWGVPMKGLTACVRNDGSSYMSVVWEVQFSVAQIL